MRRVLAGLLVCLSLVACSSRALVYEGPLDDGPGFSAYLVSYRSDGLKLHAMVAVPDQAKPAAGFPVIVANHGFVPDPTRYGITAEGIDSRPGDYYRSVPELYTSRGFLVVLPDYRGHNNSEGLEFTQRDDAIDFYAGDVVALMAGLDEIEDADMNNVFMWSHSMGGAVSMRVLQATHLVKGASFWATMSVRDTAAKTGMPEIPLILHHSVGDTSTASANSQVLAEALLADGRSHVFYSYDGTDHYFAGATRELAADRDAKFFRSLGE